MTVNQTILKDLYSENLTLEIAEYLNAAIDEELLKDDIDTDLIDDCIDALDALQENDITPALHLLLNEKQITEYCKRQTRKPVHIGRRAAAACAVIAVCASLITLSTNTAFASEVKEAFWHIIAALNRTAGESEVNPAREITSIYGIFPADFSFTVRSKDEIDLSQMTVIAVYKDGREEAILLNSCTVNRTEDFRGDPNTVLLTVGYNGCAFSVKFTIHPSEKECAK